MRLTINSVIKPPMQGLSLAELQQQYAAGQDQKWNAGLDTLFASKVWQDRLTAGVFSALHKIYGRLQAALPVFAEDFDTVTSDPILCRCATFVASVRDDRDLWGRAAERCIRHEPANGFGYHSLGMLRLRQGRFADARTVLSKGIEMCPQEAAPLKRWLAIAEHLLRGNSPVHVHFDGLDFTFRVCTFNGHALDQSGKWLAGTLPEGDELRFARRFVQQCQVIAEVGSNVGNHTVFFLKALRPKRIFAFDGDAAVIEEWKRNLALNGVYDEAIVLVRHVLLGPSAGQTSFLGGVVDIVTLTDAVGGGADFVKIDVDGMEMEVLEGARGLLQRYRPKVMIEVAKPFEARFREFLAEVKYQVVHQFKRDEDSNYFIAGE